MKFKAITGIMLTLLMVSVLAFAFSIQAVKSEPGTIIVPDDYPTIQKAINAASSGDTIEVRNGTYPQPDMLEINKTLTLRGDYRNIEHPRNPSTTIIEGFGNSTVVELNATGISISGFTIRNGGPGSGGIWSDSFNGHTIVNNIITTSDYGIYLSCSNNTKVSNNTILNNDVNGIEIDGCKKNNVTSNTISGSARCIRMTGSNDSCIFNNKLSGTSYGIFIDANSKRNTVKYNKVLSPGVTGIYVGHASDNTRIDHNYVFGGSFGIYLYQSSSCTLVYNVVSNSSTGIRLYYLSNNNNVSYNKITYCDWGIEISQSYNNTFVGNWLQQNKWGVIIQLSASEKFYYNNFVNNRVQVSISPSTTNQWDDGVSKGNYWSDYTGSGPYVIDPNNIDRYPLMEPWGENDVAVTNVVPSKTVVIPNESISINVTVENQGDYTETFNITAYYSNETITPGQWETFWSSGDVNRDGYIDETDVNLVMKAYGSHPGDPNWNPDCDFDKNGYVDPYDVAIVAGGYGLDIWYYFGIQGGSIQKYYTVNNLPPGSTEILVLTWNTTGVPYGNYTISARAIRAQNETDITNNNYDDGTVIVTIAGDIDGDGDVDLDDFAAFSGTYGTKEGDTAYKATCDFDRDGDIDLDDFAAFSGKYGKRI